MSTVSETRIDFDGDLVVSTGGKDAGHISAWQQPSPASNDFRSDTCTTATPNQLRAIAQAGLNEGWSCSGASDFERKMVKLTGRESALFMVSSTMSNQIAIRSHLDRPPYAVLCDERSHIIHMEAGGIGSFHGALMTTLRPSNGLYMSLEDIIRTAIPPDACDLCSCPTRVIHIENPLGGIIMPTDELRRICEWARSHDIRVHMDGARLWEAVAAGAGRLDEICKLPDSVNLCLTKGIGASVGSILAGDESFMERALWIRQSVGGSMRQPGFVAAAANAAILDVFGSNPDGSESLPLKKTQAQAARLAAKWQHLGGKLTVPQQTNILWLDLDSAGIEEQEWEAQGERCGLKLRGSRIIVHYQILQSNIEKLEELMEHMLVKSGPRERINKPLQIIKGSVPRVAASMKEVYAKAG